MDHLSTENKIGKVLDSFDKATILDKNRRKKPLGVLIIRYKFADHNQVIGHQLWMSVNEGFSLVFFWQIGLILVVLVMILTKRRIDIEVGMRKL